MEKLKEWFLETIIKRAIPRAVAGAIGLLASKGVIAYLASKGVVIDTAKFQSEMTILALAGADVALRHLKQGAAKIAGSGTSVGVLMVGLLMLAQPAHAWNPITDVRDNVVWTFGQSAQAGQGYDFAAKKWDTSALAEIAQYRFLSFSYGATFLDSDSTKATDTIKVGFLSSFFFKLFTNPTTPQMEWMKNLNIGPSYSLPVFSGSTGHKGVVLLDINYRFSGK